MKNLALPLTKLIYSTLLLLLMSFTSSLIAQPINDDLSEATFIACTTVVAGTTSGATLDAVPTCDVSVTAPGVWYKFMGAGMIHYLKLCSALSYDTKLSVFVDVGDQNGIELSCIEGIDDSDGCDEFQWDITLCTQYGAVYYVLVHGVGTQTGDFDLNMVCEFSDLTLTCPDDIEVLVCPDQIPAPFANYVAFEAAGGIATGSADPLTFAFENEEFLEACPYTVRRTYSIENELGCKVFCDHNVIVLEENSPIVNQLPGDMDGDVCLSDPEGACPSDLSSNSFTVNLIANPSNPMYETGTQWIAPNGNMAWSFPAPSGVGFCGGEAFANYLGYYVEGDGCEETVTIEWVIVDACSGAESDVYEQNIVWSDCAAPLFLDPPTDLTIECDGTDPLIFFEDWFFFDDGQSISDNCSYTLTNDFDGIDFDCSGTFSSTVTWTAADACGNSNTAQATFSLVDTEAPTLLCPPNITAACGQTLDDVDPGEATVLGDNCSAINEVDISSSMTSTQSNTGCSQYEYTITRTWVATDACGNSTSCMQLVDFVDDEAPTMFCLSDRFLDCTESTDTSNTGVPWAIDNCATNEEIDIDFVDLSTQSNSGCSQNQYSITRTWIATDPCGNSSTCVQTINVSDTTGPVISCPIDLDLTCNENTNPSNTGFATATDDCASINEINIAFSDVSTQSSSGCSQIQYSITRTWVATDPCGNSSTCVQTINVLDTTAPEITCPPNETLTCFESIPSPATSAADFIALGGTISDDCTTNLNDFIVFSANDDNGGDNCPGNNRSIIRTYYVQDACGNTTTCEQVFTYLESTQGPVITSVLPSCYKYCGDMANPEESDVTYTTDCSFGASVNITGPVLIGQDNCPGSIYRFTYVVTDDCGRSSTPVTRDFIIGNDEPTIECAAFNLILECGDPNNQAYIDTYLEQVSANTSCDLGYTISHFPQNFNLTTCGSATVVTFVATDACGRTASCTTSIGIQDNSAPVISSSYQPGICDEIPCGSDLNYWFDHWMEDVLANLSTTDNCDANVSFTTIPANPSPLQNCPDETTETIVIWVANDNCGNTSTVAYSFYVTEVDAPEPPQTVAIYGTVYTETNEPIETVVVSLNGSEGLPESYTTTNDGSYIFDSLPIEQNYQVSPYLNQNPLNGVSSYDLILIAQHILGIAPLDSPYKMIAADINRSGAITTLDLVELRKMILYVNADFPENTSWRFIAEDFVFPDATNPFATVFPEQTNINNLIEEMLQDFIGVKIGDVNNSAIANSLVEGGGDRGNKHELLLEVDEMFMHTDDTYEIAFNANNFNDLHGYQFSLKFDASALDLVKITPVGLEELDASNFGLSLLDKGIITTSWTSLDTKSISPETVLFRLTFTAKQSVMLSEVLNLSSDYTEAEAYDLDLNFWNVSLRFDNGIEQSNENKEVRELVLYQNHPNPFSDNTLITFEIPKATIVTLSVYDLSGNLIKEKASHFEKGVNGISLQKADLLESGMYIYRLNTKDSSVTKKLILLE